MRSNQISLFSIDEFSVSRITYKRDNLLDENLIPLFI